MIRDMLTGWASIAVLYIRGVRVKGFKEIMDELQGIQINKVNDLIQ